MSGVERILETAIYVDDLPRATTFYRSVFGFEALVESERLVAFDVSGTSVLLLFKRAESVKGLATAGGWIPPHDASGPAHFAFAIARDAVESWKSRLLRAGVAIESIVQWERGGTSLYFRDPDNHSVELVTQGTWKTW